MMIIMKQKNIHYSNLSFTQCTALQCSRSVLFKIIRQTTLGSEDMFISESVGDTQIIIKVGYTAVTYLFQDQMLGSDAPTSINDVAGSGCVGGLGECHHDH